MEEKLRNAFKDARRDESPDSLRSRIIRNLCREMPSNANSKPDYVQARKNGLTICESEHALALAEEIRNKGVEEILQFLITPRIEKLKEFPHKRLKKNRKEAEIRKKKKLGSN